MPLNELFTRLADFNEDNNKVSQAKRTGDTSKLTTTQRDQLRQPGTNAVLNGKEVKWGGQNYGWQSPASFKKLEQGPEFRAGHIAHTRINADVNSAISSLLTPVVKAIGEDNIKTAVDTVSTVHETALKYVPQYKQTATALKIGLNNLEKFNESVSKATNVSPLITGEILTEAATLGGGKALKIGNKVVNTGLDALTAGGRAAKNAPPLPKRFGGYRSTPKGEVGAVTINNSNVLKTTGRKLGEDIIKNDPDLALHLTKRSERLQQLENKLTQNSALKEIYEESGDKAALKQVKAKIKKTRPLLYSERSNVKPFTDDDFQLYGANNLKTDRDKLHWAARRVESGEKITEHIHKHHLVTKGGTNAAFEKMEDFVKQGKADPDDLVVMFEYAEKKGAAPGDRLSNNAYIQDTPHSELHQQVLIPAGDEFKQEQWKKILNEVKTPEDLMTWWVDQVDNNYVPNKNTGLIWQELDDLIKHVRSS